MISRHIIAAANLCVEKSSRRTIKIVNDSFSASIKSCALCSLHRVEMITRWGAGNVARRRRSSSRSCSRCCLFFCCCGLSSSCWRRGARWFFTCFRLRCWRSTKFWLNRIYQWKFTLNKSINVNLKFFSDRKLKLKKNLHLYKNFQKNHPNQSPIIF